MYVPVNISSSQLAWWNHLRSVIYQTGMPSHPGKRNISYARNCKSRFSTTPLLWKSRDNSYSNPVTTVTQCNWLGPLNDVYVTTSGILQGSLAPRAPRACVGHVTWTWTTHACTWQLRIPDLERWLQDDWEDVRLIFITKSSQIL